MQLDAPAGPASQFTESPLTVVSRADLIRMTRRDAVEAGCTARSGEACGIAEGGLRVDAERYGSETEYGQALVAAIFQYGIDSLGDWDGSAREGVTGRMAWDELMARVWPDVSFGAFQITVQHADAFGDGSPSWENVMAFRNWTRENPRASIQWAMGYLASKYRPGEDDAEWKALNRYNWPAGDGRPFKGNGDNYRRALAQAAP